MDKWKDRDILAYAETLLECRYLRIDESDDIISIIIGNDSTGEIVVDNIPDMETAHKERSRIHKLLTEHGVIQCML